MTLSLLVILGLALADYLLKDRFMINAGYLTEDLVMSQSRILGLIELNLHARSLLNVANDLEFQDYADDFMQGNLTSKITRFIFLRQLV